MTTEKVLYSEEQRFNQPWLWILLITVNGAVIAGAVTAAIKQHNWGVSLVIAVPLLATWFIASVRLDTAITREGIHYRFFPLHLKSSIVKWENIERAYVRQYNPLLEFGGWGMRYKFSGDIAYNIRGTMGLQLELINGKKMLIGTQEPEALAAVLSTLGMNR